MGEAYFFCTLFPLFLEKEGKLFCGRKLRSFLLRAAVFLHEPRMRSSPKSEEEVLKWASEVLRTCSGLLITVWKVSES